jgi:hypothetical protein
MRDAVLGDYQLPRQIDQCIDLAPRPREGRGSPGALLPPPAHPQMPETTAASGSDGDKSLGKEACV